MHRIVNIIIIKNSIAPTLAPMIKPMLLFLPFDKDEEFSQVALLVMHKKLLYFGFTF